MAEDGAVATGQYRSELARERHKGWVPDRVHAAMNSVQPARGQPMGNRSVTQSGREQLSPGDQSKLTARDLCDHGVRVGLQNPTLAVALTSLGAFLLNIMHFAPSSASEGLSGELLRWFLGLCQDHPLPSPL
jgi:hypothetical protein